MDDEQLEKLIVSLEANTDKLDKAILKSSSLLDRELRAMEDRVGTFSTRMERAFARAGSGANKLMAAAGISLSVAAIGGFVDHIATAAESVNALATATGFSTDAAQEYAVVAEHAGVAQDKFSLAMEVFNKNVGLAKLGTTEFGKVLARMGVDTSGTTQQIFLRFVDALQRVGVEQQRAAVIGLAFGKGNAEIAGFVNQGSAAIERQAAAVKASGQTMSGDTIAKVIQLKNAWADLQRELTVAGAGVVGGAASEMHKITSDISGPGFQTALQNFGKIMADIAGYIVKMAPYWPQIAGAVAGMRVGGLLGAVVGVVGATSIQQGGIARGLGSLGGDILGLFNSDFSGDLDRNRFNFLNHSLIPEYRGDVDFQRGAPGSKVVNPDNLKAAEARLAAAERERDALQAKLDGSNVDKPISGKSATVQDYQAWLAQSGIKGAAGPNIDLKGVGTPHEETAYEKAVQSLRDRIAALQAQKGALGESTEATEKERAATELLTAAQDDAAKKGGTVTAAQKEQIDKLSTAYAQLAASRAWDKDIATEDQRIEKLRNEGLEAGKTAAALATLQSKSEQLDKFHETFGRAPNADEMAGIDTRANAAGQAQAGSDYAKAVTEAEKQIAAMRSDASEIGLFGAALAEAKMRQELLNAAMAAGLPIDEKTLSQITALSKQMGQVSEAAEKERQSYTDQVDVMNELRNGLDSLAATGVNGFRNLRSAAQQFVEQLAQLIIKLYIMQPLLNAAFGQQGTSGGGMMGPAMKGLFGMMGGGGGASGGIDTVGITPGVNGFSSDFSGQAAAPTVEGMFSSAASWLGSMFADGGKIDGRGGPRDDKVIARVSPGEFVINANSTSRYSDVLEAINEGRELPAYASGGFVGGRLASPRIPSASQMRSAPAQLVNNITIPIDARGGELGVEDKIAGAMQDAAPHIIAESMRQMSAVYPELLRTTLRDRS